MSMSKQKKNRSTKRKRLLFTCENRQEVGALVPIAKETEKLSNGQIQCEFLSQEAFYCQGVDDALRELRVRIAPFSYPIRLSRPFAFNSLSTKLKLLLVTNRWIAPIMKYYDGLVCGVDSAPARMLITSAHRLGKPTFQVIISLLLSEEERQIKSSLKGRIRYRLKRWFGQLTGMDFLTLPTGPAKSGCDRIFVMGERVKEALVRNGVPEERILVYGVPRFAQLFELQKCCDSNYHSTEHINILYLTGAFLSHGMDKQHYLEQRQLQEIVNIVKHLSDTHSGNYRLIVKIHPRAREEHFAWLARHGQFVQVLPSNADLYKAILKSFIVLTICSTASYEAVLLNRPVIITRFPNPEALGYNSLADDFHVVDSTQDLMDIIINLSNDHNLYTKLLADESKSVDFVIDPKTPRSAFLIAQRICTDMGVVVC